MIKLFVDNHITKVDADRTQHHTIKKALEYDIHNWHIMRKINNGQANTTASMYDIRRKAFFTGLLPTVVKYLKQIQVPYKIYDVRTKDTEIKIHPYHVKGFEQRAYQDRAVKTAIEKERGVIKVATGGGKTLISAMLVRALRLPTLFITHKIDLLEQTYEKYQTILGDLFSIGVIGARHYEEGFVTIATKQTLYELFKKDPKETAKLLKQYKCLIIDEAHRVSSKSFYTIATLASNAYYRIGLTATPFMAENPADNMILRGVTGNIIVNVTAAELIEAGVLAQPFFKFIEITQPANIMQYLSDWHEVYSAGIVNNEQRNTIILQKTNQLVKNNKRCLIIVQRIEHGEILKKALNEQPHIKCQFASGQNDKYERSKILKKIQNGELNVVIATNIFDEGIDVQNISAVILAAGTKSAPALFQRTGRAMRKKEDNYAIIIDFIDRQHPMLAKHSEKRFKLISDEPGYKIL